MLTPLRDMPLPTIAPPGPRILIVSGSVGAGHDGAARELAARLARAGAVAEVRDFLDAVPRGVARLLRDGYTGTVGHAPFAFEFLFRRLEHRGLFWRIEQLVCAAAQEAVWRWIDGFQPDVVVSTYPLASQTLGAMRADGRVPVPVMTYLTDPAVHASWLHPAVDAHVTVTAATSRQGALDYGLSFATAGPLVPERFARVPGLEELVELRAALRAPSGRPLALLVTGSLGLGDLLPTVAHVSSAGMTPVVLCGRNDDLRRRLAGVPRVISLGWRSDVHRLMHVSDVLVQNAGGLSFTEAYVSGLPAVTYRPIPGHGRANARALDEAGLAPWARTPAQLVDVLHDQCGQTRIPPMVDDPTDLVLALAPVPMGAGGTA